MVCRRFGLRDARGTSQHQKSRNSVVNPWQGRICCNPSGAGTVFAAKVLNSSTYNASQAIGRQSGLKKANTGGAYGDIRVLNLTITPKSATKLSVTAGSKYVLI